MTTIRLGKLKVMYCINSILVNDKSFRSFIGKGIHPLTAVQQVAAHEFLY